ncbi:SDR family oxidoreductase [Spirulina subsalsa FACHB-351]|uniref:SDR family oxidoreductase n=1 Tax=Spirulina subsalsa FACHB-351 TaxID=234711 RepID=A0ABT3L5W7_9CYAN|nr:SDR family oxidoreductase [Spirulina subsalsa]MCW6036889.1 SDR family oxidoreductase [Spirulina subsalsa FACHB-351]
MIENTILIAGASRGVGQEIAQQLRQEGKAVVALLRSPSASPDLNTIGVKVAQGDAFNPSDLAQIFQQNPSISVVISTLGGVSPDGRRVDDEGNINLIDVAVQAGVQHFLLVSSIGTSESSVALPPQVLETLKGALIAKAKAEQHLINSGLTYTIIRPGGLKSEPATHQAILSEDYRISGLICRADVASLVCSCVGDESRLNKVFSAIDPTLEMRR